MLDRDAVDVDAIATALANQKDYDGCWLVNPNAGEVGLWTSDTGIDGENPVDLDELDLVMIEPLPPYIWYRDMVDFAEGLSDHDAGRRLSASLAGKGAFSPLQGLDDVCVRRARHFLDDRRGGIFNRWFRLQARVVGDAANRLARPFLDRDGLRWKLDPADATYPGVPQPHALFVGPPVHRITVRLRRP